MPRHGRGGGTVRKPRGERARIAPDGRAVPHDVDDPARAADDPRPHVRVRRIAVHLQRRGPCRPAIGRTAHVDVVIVRVDPGDIHVAGLVDRRRREQVPHGTAGAGRRTVMDERNPGPLHEVDVTRDHVDVVASDARQVQIAKDGIELRLAARGSGADRQFARGPREDETTGEILRSRRSGRAVHLHPGRELVDREEDRVVARRRGRSVVDGIPLPILRRVGRDRVLPPRVPAVVRDGCAQVREAFEVDEVGEPLVVGHDIRVTAARRRVWSLG